MPKISVVLPVYNGERYLRRAIESILNQEEADLELIIVNDCSTDSSSDIIEEYATKDKRVVVINNEINRKLPRSLNEGFCIAKGDFFTWTSDDNYYLPHALKKMADFLEENSEYPMVVANMDTIDENDNFIKQWTKFDNHMMYYNDYVGACFMYRKEVKKDIGDYNPEMFLVEDYDYWLRVMFKYGNIGHIDETLYKYRMHENSLTTTRYFEVRRQLCVLRKKYIVQLIDKLSADKDLLVRIYYELVIADCMDSETRDMFVSVIPEISIDSYDTSQKEIIIYGAGKIGKHALEKVKAPVKYFCDSQKERENENYCNKLIISPKTMHNVQNDYQIIVAVGTEKMYSVLSDFGKWDIKKCTSIYTYMASENAGDGAINV